MSILCIVICACPARSDFKKIWTRKELQKESHIVVIATPQKTVESKKEINLLKEHGVDIDLLKVETIFKVVLPIKGEVASGAEIVVEHYKIKSINQKVVQSPPKLVEFRTVPNIVSNDKTRKVVVEPDYLLYLIKGKSDKYEFVSGDYYSEDSIFEVNVPWSDTTSMKR